MQTNRRGDGDRFGRRKMEEEAKGEYEIEREETVRWGIALEGIYAEEEEYAEMRSAMY